MKDAKISLRQIQRYPVYLKILSSLKEEGKDIVTSLVLANLMNSSEEQVRKDLQAVSSMPGKPKIGRNIDELIRDIETFLGFNASTDSILIGVGHLGNALLNFSGFSQYGLNIVMGFDIDPNKIGKPINGKMIYDIKDLEKILLSLDIKVAILVTPRAVAQEMCDKLISLGIKAIWNFAPTHLIVKDDIVVENVDLASSLATLTRKLDLKEFEDKK